MIFLVIIEQTFVLDLCVIITLEDDSNEYLEEDQIDYELITQKEQERYHWISTPNSLILANIDKLVICGIVNALSLGTILKGKGCHYVTPRITWSYNKQSNERVGEVFKVYVIIHTSVSFDLTE